MTIGNYRVEHRATTMLLNIFLLLMLSGAVAYAETGQGVRPFREGTMRMSVMLGGGTAFEQNYTIFGIGGGYYVADGIQVGLDADAWTGNDHGIHRLSPQLRYVFQTDSTAKPYIGTFYRRMFIRDYADNDTVGLRAGALFVSGRSAFIGAGLVQDVHLNCDRTVYSSCADTYTELLIEVMF